MSSGTIFVICLTGAFAVFIAYLAILSRRSQKRDEENRKGEAMNDAGITRENSGTERRERKRNRGQ
jgi:hypothetical protein